jgi:hypothetical protein
MAHSRFKIPCEWDETTMCDIKKGTKLSQLLQLSSLIIWDEALMTSRTAFEALDRTLQDLLSTGAPQNKEIPFGGRTVILEGDLRQILPIVEGGSRAEIVNAAIVNSPLWSSITILHFKQNMRLFALNISEQERNEIRDFSQWLLDIGDGNIEAFAKEDEEELSWIRIPTEYLPLPEQDKISCIVDEIYNDLQMNYAHAEYLRDQAILTPTNDIVDTINTHIVSLIPDVSKQYLSCDRIIKAPGTHDSYDLLYLIEFLHTISANNFPQHDLVLKKGVPVMLLRNINQAEGLCNGTRLTITALGDMVIEGTIMTGTHQGKKVLIPRISLTLKNTKWPFILERRQYPIKNCYAMTINKSQGQTLKKVGVYTSKHGLKILIEDDNGDCSDITKNIVF